jgi:putative membrane protein
MTDSATLQRDVDRRFYIFNASLSVAALAFLAYILVLRPRTGALGVDLRFLPAVNASLNAAAATLLCIGYVAIRRRAQRLHKYCMVSAFAVSALFLVCYLSYHFVHGDTNFPGTGLIRPIYFFILISHILLSMSVIPLALTSFYFANRKTFRRHKKIARVTLPIWLYVSVTGVIIFFLLKSSGAIQ